MKKMNILEQKVAENEIQQVIDAQGIIHDGLLELALTFCKPKIKSLESFKYGNKHPNGMDSLSFMRKDGGWNYITVKNNVLWFERYPTNNSTNPKDGYQQGPFEECQNLIGSNIPTISKPQSAAMAAYTKNHKGVIKEKPTADIIRDYTPIDMYSKNPILFPTKGLVFVYERSALNGIEPDQVEALKKILAKTNWTIDIPEIGTAENQEGKDAIFQFQKLGLLTPEVNTILVNGNKKRATSTIESERGPLKIYPIASEGSSESDMVSTLGDLENDIKSKIMSRKACRKSIKFLSKKSKEENGKGYRTSDVDPKDLANARQFANSCVTQGTKYLGGIIGINDEIKELRACRNPWCLGQPCPTGQSWDGQRCKVIRMNENKSNLGTLIRENLLEIKEKKTKSILSEGKIVKGRLSIISENVILKTNKQKDKFFGDLLSEMVYLNSQGFDKEIINEGFFDVITGLLGHAPEGIMEYFKEYIGKWLVKHLTPADENGWIGNMIITGIGNLPISEVSKLTDCNYLTKWISKTAAEGTVRKLTHDKGLDGAFYDVLRNSIIDMMDKSALGSKIEEGLGGIICPLLGGVKSKMDNAADKLKEKALAK
jgi:hypothetical protein